MATKRDVVVVVVVVDDDVDDDVEALPNLPIGRMGLKAVADAVRRKMVKRLDLDMVFCRPGRKLSAGGRMMFRFTAQLQLIVVVIVLKGTVGVRMMDGFRRF